MTVVTGLVLVAACSTPSSVTPSNVTFDVELIEVKGATDGLAPPETDPKTLSAGYGYTAPGDFNTDKPDQWQVGTYMYSPGAMSVIQGDMVTLRVFGVNGDEHAMFVRAPDGSTVVDAFTVNRGREVTVTFTADQSGHYKIVCSSHAPTMTADILSIPG